MRRFDCTNTDSPYGISPLGCMGCHRMRESELGDYVRFDDADAEIARLRAEVERFKEACGYDAPHWRDGGATNVACEPRAGVRADGRRFLTRGEERILRASLDGAGA